MNQKLIEDWQELVELEAVLKERKKELQLDIIKAAVFDGKNTGYVNGTQFRLRVTKNKNVKYDKAKLVELIDQHEDLLPLFNVSFTERTGEFNKYCQRGGEFRESLLAIRTEEEGSPKIEITNL